MSEIKQTIAKNIKNIRKANHLTQEQLAEKAGITLRQLARIESAESFISANTLEKLCAELGVTAKDLFNENLAQHSSLSKNFIQLAENIENIADDDKKVEFLNLALASLSDGEAISKLKLLLLGFELKTLTK